MRMVYRDITPSSLDWVWEQGSPGGATWKTVLEIKYARRSVR
jgi:hypothetical protein